MGLENQGIETDEKSGVGQQYLHSRSHEALPQLIKVELERLFARYVTLNWIVPCRNITLRSH